MSTRKPTRKPAPTGVSPTSKAPPKVATKVVAKKVGAAKPAAKPAAVVAVKAATPAKTVAAKPAVPARPKLKMVRDSFTMPKAEYAAIDTLKQRAAQLARPAKKSELLRAGIKALSGLSDKALLAALQAVPTIKTGRPHKA